MERHRGGHGAPPVVGLNRPATPSVTDGLAVADEERTRQKVLRSPCLSTHIRCAPTCPWWTPRVYFRRGGEP